MPPGITIVGLGPGGSDLWTEAARKTLTSAREIRGRQENTDLGSGNMVAHGPPSGG
jgi:precorrin-3B methylase